MLRRIALVSALVSLLAPPQARADARADIVDLRHDRSPTRHELLGWTPAGEAALRWIVCSEGGERQCRAGVGAFGVGTERVTTTLEHAGYDRLPVADAIAFIRSERAAIDALGPLTAGPPAVDGRLAFGVVGGVASEVRARIVRTPDLDPGGIVRLAVHAGSRRVELGRAGVAFSIDGLAVAGYPSPDGARVALVAHVESTTMCWSFSDLEIVVADVGDVRTRLSTP